MKHLLLALTAIVFVQPLFVQPLSGQSKWVASYLAPNGAMLVYFGADGKDVQGRLYSLIRNDEFVELDLRLQILDAASQSAATVMGELGAPYGSTWALADWNGRRIAAGDKVPDAGMIAQELEKAGIRSPIKILRDFLKRHPDHLEARDDLLLRLRDLAEMRTIKKLQIGFKTWNEIYRQGGNPNSDEYDADTSGFWEKRLDPKDDAEIWGEYAKELESLYRADDWRLSSLSRHVHANSQLEVCSELMRGLYRRLLPQVKQAFFERSSELFMRRLFIAMRRISGAKDSVQPIVDTLESQALDPESFTIPSDLLIFLVEEARENNKWDYLADMQWKTRQSIINNHIYMQLTRSKDSAVVFSISGFPIMVDPEGHIKNVVEPLLESLIRASRADDAEYIITSLARLPINADLPKRAAQLAAECGRPDLESAWSRLQVPAKTRNGNEELEAVLSHGFGRGTCVVLINGEGNKTQVESLIETGALMDWELSCVALNDEMSELMLKRENWYGNEPRWALLSRDRRRVISSGQGAPTEADIVNVLEQGNVVKTVDFWRQFLRQHPGNFTAKEGLLEILKKIAAEKTKSKIQSMQGSSSDLELSPDDDSMIWREYSILFRELVQYYSTNRMPFTYWTPMVYNEGEMSCYSPIMKSVAKELLPLISLNLLKKPGDTDYWRLWVLLSDPASSAQFSNLMDNIVPSPFDEYFDVPGIVNRSYVAVKYKDFNNWRGIVDVWEPFWEKLRADGEINFAKNFINPYQNRASTMPLAEAYLNLGQELKLREWLEIWKQSPRWSSLEPEMVKLFEQFGKVYPK